MNRLSGSEQDSLHDAVATASDYVAGGCHPTAAVEKAAAVHNLPPGGRSLVATALNVGRQLALRDVNRDPVDKFAAFELADPTGADSAYASGAEKHADYAAPPTWAKVASTEKRAHFLHTDSYTVVADPKRAAPSSISTLLKKKGDYKVAQDQVRRAEAAAEDALAKTAAAFASGGWKAGQIKVAAEAHLAPRTKDVVALAFTKAGWDYEATPLAPSTPVFNAAAGPFPQLADLCTKIAALEDFVFHKEAVEADLEKAAVDAAPIFGSLQIGGPNVEDEEDDSDPKAQAAAKAAGLLGLGVLNTSSSLFPKTMPTPATREERMDDVNALADSLESPSFESERRAIHAQAILAEAMSDADDPIAGHDPDTVMRGFNEISRIAPQATLNSATLKPMLRRWLAGNQQPHEIGQFAELEQQMRRVDQPNETT